VLLHIFLLSVSGRNSDQTDNHRAGLPTRITPPTLVVYVRSP
jgi:hypothetical protein